MNKFLVVLALCVCYFSMPVFAFGGTTHQRVTEEATHQVKTTLPRSNILSGCIYPDQMENGNLYSGHFYDPLFDFVRPSEDNALTRMEAHFRLAQEAYSRSDTSMAGFELGQALHYIQDMCCPVHTWGYNFSKAPMRVLMHRAYEDAVDAVSYHTFKTHTPQSTDVRLTAIYWSKLVFQSSDATFIRRAAGKAESPSGWVAKIISFNGKNPVSIIGHPILTRLGWVNPTSSLDPAVAASCDLIYQFCKSTGAPFRLQPTRGFVGYSTFH